ncbi:hypothetical protein HDU98_012304 [Podochytrium sp. JEL0797]|nr:hypothetical protein HDU98_012304 [Podochytrium sp. JEL0797]
MAFSCFTALQAACFFPLIAIYTIYIAPLQTIYTYLTYRLFQTHGFEHGYFSHVGVFGDHAVRVFRFPEWCGVKAESLLGKGMLEVVGRVQGAFGGGRVKKMELGVWIGEEGVIENTHVVLYFHGGGYVSGSPYMNVGFGKLIVGDWEKGAVASDKKLRVFVAKYPTCPESSLGEILKKCVDAYKHLVGLGYTSISIMGDSAGGNAALNVVSILATQFPTLVQPVSAIVYGPWVDPKVSILPPKYPNEVAAQHDILSLKGSRRMAEIVERVTDEKDLVRLSPVNWDDEKLRSCVPKKGGLLVVYGGGELLRAGIDLFVERVQKVCGEVVVKKKRYPYMPHGFHVLFLGVVGPGKKAALDSVKESVKFLKTSC